MKLVLQNFQALSEAAAVPECYCPAQSTVKGDTEEQPVTKYHG
jgi:hypothetical protein